MAFFVLALYWIISKYASSIQRFEKLYTVAIKNLTFIQALQAKLQCKLHAMCHCGQDFQCILNAILNSHIRITFQHSIPCVGSV